MIKAAGLLLIVALLVGILAGCDEGKTYDFMHGHNRGYWGDYDYDDHDDYDDYDDYDYDDYDDFDDVDRGGNDKGGGENGGGNSDGGNSTGNGGTSTSAATGNGNQNGGTPEGDAEYTDSAKFEYSLYGCDDGEAAISSKSSCTDENVVVPPTYTDYAGETYRIVKDCQRGFSMLDAKTITLPEGFKEIRVGFSDCVNLKTIYLPSTITTICGYALTNCMRLDKIVFNGTKAQWNAIELDDHWNYCTPALGIECTDGYIELQSWYESH